MFDFDFCELHYEMFALISVLCDLMWQVGDEQQNAKAAGGRSSITGSSIVNNQSDDVMSDLARRLQERRAKTDILPPVSSDFYTSHFQ